MIEPRPLPHDRRNFVHRRIGRAAKSFVTSGFNPLAAAGAFVQPVRGTLPRSQTARPSAFSEAGKGLGRRVKFGAGLAVGTAGTAIALGQQGGTESGPCPGVFSVRGPGGTCIDLTALPPGGDPAITQQFGGAGGPAGEAVMGRYGAAMVPGSRIVDRAVCLRGMVVADDGLCYNRSQVRNSQRMWPKGRRPLLTGGDMRAISIAARAGARLERTTKRLQKIGLMKKPARVNRGGRLLQGAGGRSVVTDGTDIIIKS